MSDSCIFYKVTVSWLRCALTLPSLPGTQDVDLLHRMDHVAENNQEAGFQMHPDKAKDAALSSGICLAMKILKSQKGEKQVQEIF